MRILVLGGGQFAGRSFVEQAMERGHETDVFNRGRSLDPSQSAASRSFIGDRDPRAEPGLASLEEAIASGVTWDAVIDMCGYVPRVVRASAELLRRAEDLPAPVVIDEAIEVAKAFGGESSPGFVNGVLDAVARELRAVGDDRCEER